MSTIPRIDLTDQRIEEYLFKRRIGEGGFGDVWLALEIGIDMKSREVAIKVFAGDAEDLYRQEEIKNNFLRDMDTMRTLSANLPIVSYIGARTATLIIDYKGIPSTSSHVADDDKITVSLFLIVMEYADGGALGEGYSRSVVHESGDASHLDHFIDICHALERIHQLGYIHRDIKPKNLLWFKNQSKVKIADFGIAKKNISQADYADYIAGTFPYLAPEAFSGPSTIESDVYALGCTFYELFAMQPAFKVDLKKSATADEARKAWESAHLSSDRPDTLILAGTILSFKLNQIIRRMMAVSPEDRPALVEVRGALEEEKSRSYIRPDAVLEAANSIDVAALRPIFLSQYLVNPVFLQEHIGNSLFFLFIRLPTQHSSKIATMFAFLARYFDKSYSIFEVYGRFDLVIRVWSDTGGVLIHKFAKDVITHVLETDRSALNCFRAGHVNYFNFPPRKTISPKIGQTEALIKLHELQNGGAADASVIRWLRDRSVLVRQHPSFDPLVKIQVFVLIRVLDVTNLSQLDNFYTEIRVRLGESKLDFNKNWLCHYSKTYEPINGLEDSEYHFIISYVGGSHKGVAKMTEELVSRLQGVNVRFRMDSHLATGRLFVFSERLRFGGLGSD